ncbi:uncharacterized protein LOC122509986 [Leptopilina heterotoma]|uniref:uncharacterized protein LOC122509986 n=1 Tax=Leptopilina heterotoma TaxID=63436 RepID=UPI001CA85D19|nr:uncharacterized protein LOC122509986 [Leptopilina heterotoma]
MEVYRPEAAFDMNLLTFKLFGVWPSSVKHPLLRFIYKIYGYAIHLCYIGGHLPTQFSSMYIMRGDMKELVDNSFFTLTCIGYASKLIVFILQRKKLEEFFDRLKNPMFFPKRKKHLDVLNEYTISARTNTAIYISLVLATCTTWIIFPLVDSKQISPSTLQFYMFLQYQICIMYQIFLYAWRGNDITLKTIELRDAIYECGWITVPNIKFRRSLYIIMSRLQIIKIAYTFYVLLKQVNAKKTANSM